MKIIIDKCKECGAVVTDPGEVEAIEATGLCLSCVWRREKEETMQEENNERGQESSQLL